MGKNPGTVAVTLIDKGYRNENASRGARGGKSGLRFWDGWRRIPAYEPC